MVSSDKGGNMNIDKEGFSKRSDIKVELTGRAIDVLLQLGVHISALATQVPCPICGSEGVGVSFNVSEQTNRFYCTECCPRGGSLVDLVIALGQADSFKQACIYLRREVLSMPSVAVTNLNADDDAPYATDRGGQVDGASPMQADKASGRLLSFGVPWISYPTNGQSSGSFKK